MRIDVHAGRIHPHEEWLVGPDLPAHVVDRRGGGFVVDRLHPLAGERASILDSLPTNTAPMRLLGRIVPSLAAHFITPRGELVLV